VRGPIGQSPHSNLTPRRGKVEKISCPSDSDRRLIGALNPLFLSGTTVQHDESGLREPEPDEKAVTRRHHGKCNMSRQGSFPLLLCRTRVM
jgi:hypothetical protein